MAERGHGAARRWAAVLALVAGLLATPSLLGALPATDADTPATDLRDAVLAGDGVGFSGYAESAGGLLLPVADQLTSLADLLSDRTVMRVWWRGPDDNRVDVLTATGEIGVHRDAGGTWTWEYEDAIATRADPSPLALPAPPDLLPTSLGRRLLSEAADDELSRLGAQRIAGRDTLGLRVTPAAAASSVERVDLWVDAETGLTLQVEVYARGADRPALDARFIDLTLTRPAADVTAFVPPAGATVRTDQTLGILEAGRRVTVTALPAELAGLPRRELAGAPGSIGVYGSGVTLLAATPLPGRFAHDLWHALTAAPGAVVDGLGVRVAAGPLSVMLVESPGRGGAYLLSGTVTLDALAAAAAVLPAVPDAP